MVSSRVSSESWPSRVTQRQTSAADEPVSFSKDVLPILQKNCQSCHRPGQIAPMSLVTFRETRPWARSMKSQGREPADAAVVRRSRARPVRQRPLALTEATSRRSRSGRMPAHPKAIRRMRRHQSSGRRTAGRSSRTSSSADPSSACPRTRRTTSWSGSRISFRAASRRTPGSRRSRSSRACWLSRITSASRSSHTRPTRSTTCRTGRSRRATMKAPRSRQRRRQHRASAARPTRAGRPAQMSAAASTVTCLGDRQTTIGHSARAS